MTSLIILTGQHMKVTVAIYFSMFDVDIFLGFAVICSALFKVSFLSLQHRIRATFTQAMLITPATAQRHQ